MPNIAAAGIIRLINTNFRCRTATLALSSAGMMVRKTLEEARAKKITVAGSDDAFQRAKKAQEVVSNIDHDRHVPSADEIALLWRMVSDFYRLCTNLPERILKAAYDTTTHYFKSSAVAMAKMDVPLPVRLSGIRIFSGRPIREEMSNRPAGMSEAEFRSKLLLFAQLAQKFSFAYNVPTILSLAEAKGHARLHKNALFIEDAVPRVEVKDMRQSA